jgi:hypothetical protein
MLEKIRRLAAQPAQHLDAIGDRRRWWRRHRRQLIGLVTRSEIRARARVAGRAGSWLARRRDTGEGCHHTSRVLGIDGAAALRFEQLDLGERTARRVDRVQRQLRTTANGFVRADHDASDAVLAELDHRALQARRDFAAVERVDAVDRTEHGLEVVERNDVGAGLPELDTKVRRKLHRLPQQC